MRLRFADQTRNANSNDAPSTSTSSSQTKTASVSMSLGRGRKRSLRLLDGLRFREIDAEEDERLRANWLMTRGGVDGLPHRTSTEETIGEREYVAAIDWRMGMRDSEKPLMRTVILSGRRFCGSHLLVGPHSYGSEDFALATNNRMARMKTVAGELIAAAHGGVEVLTHRWN